MSLLRPFRAAAPQRAQNFRTACLSSYCRGVDAAPTPPLAHRSHVVLCPTTVPFDFSCYRCLSRRHHRRRRQRFHASFSASDAAARSRRCRRHPRRRPMGGGKASTAAPVATPSWTPSRSSACPPLLLPPKKAPSNHKSPLFCSSFLPLTWSSQSSVCLVSPSCFWAGETWGGKWGKESDSATNSAGERLRSEPAGACGLWLQGMLAPGRQRPQAKLNGHQGPATIFKNKGMGYSKHCAQGMLNTRVLPLHSVTRPGAERQRAMRAQDG